MESGHAAGSERTWAARLLEIITDRAHPAHRETLTWYGRRFDPEAFNLDRTNRDINATLRPNLRTRYRQ